PVNLSPFLLPVKVANLESSCDVYAQFTLTTVQPTRVETCLRASAIIPQSAIATGIVDQVLPPAEMARTIYEII
ncbi:MAG: hypothetical protein PX483_10525, partial [Nostocales cyanobacterium LE14-WE4]|nr:hypothetical protein [Nostocales cyanobacterium LE14-WE4]